MPTLAVWKFASCDGCQLSLLDCEDELLALAGEVRIAHFLEASAATVRGPYDLSLIEGSITTPADAERILEVRRLSKRLVTIGACATAGGIQALRNFADVREFTSVVYATPEYISTLERSDAISAYVPVDFELRGCPIDRRQLLDVITAFLHGRRPNVAAHSVCVDCKLAGKVCVMVAKGEPCLGPVTHSGCGALCPAVGRGCYGCFGPKETPNTRSLSRWLVAHDVPVRDVALAFRTFNAAAQDFSKEAEALTHRGLNSRTLHVDALARVEGEGAMHIQVRDGRVSDVQLQIYEPPRFFEALLRGRKHTEPPDITARICGICPVAYQMSACRAIEDACGVTVEGAIADLRRLIYCGEWIESHALHVYMLHAPDFLGLDGAVELAQRHRDIVERGLQLKKIGNRILEVVGGRAIHPVNVKVGGFYRAPTTQELAPLREQLRWALDAALATVEWVAGFDFPDFEHQGQLVALSQPGTYPIDAGTRLRSSGGLDFSIEDFEQHIIEEHVPHSNALHARLLGEKGYLVGALARYSLNSPT